LNDILALLFMLILVVGLSSTQARVESKNAKGAETEEVPCCSGESEEGQG